MQCQDYCQLIYRLAFSLYSQANIKPYTYAL
nr:MAG TPA: hypothetical protein [Caudoviricetes sp.]